MLIPTIQELQQRKAFKAMVAEAVRVSDILAKVRDEHDLHSFYSSRVLLVMDPGDRGALLDGLMQKFPAGDHALKVAYLKKEFASLQKYVVDARAAIENVFAEDVIQLFEYVLARIRHQGIGPDGYMHDDAVLNSQHEHLTSVFSDAIAFIGEEDVRFSGRRNGHKAVNCVSLGLALSRRRAVWGRIVDVLHGAYVPQAPAYAWETYGQLKDSALSADNCCHFFLAAQPEYWRRLEIYRDLNIGYLTHKDAAPEVLRQLLDTTGMVKMDRKTSVARVDLAKCDDMGRELEFHNIARMLDPIYGGTGRQFLYQGNAYRLDDLIDCAHKLRAAADRIETASLNGLHKRPGKFFALGVKSLARQLNIPPPRQPLINLFCYDCSDAAADPRFLPLVRNANIYYLIPSLILQQSFDKVIDKILSNRDVEVLGQERGKGLSFESTIGLMIQEAGYQWGKTNRDEKKSIPEIDGVFPLSSNIMVIYEAKCSVKPEERNDAYSFLENHMARAVHQLGERLEFLRTRPGEAESRLGFNIQKHSIIPMIITNHSYFTGLTATSVNGDRIFVVDFDLFQYIVGQRKMPSWEYDPSQGAYIREEINLNNDGEMLEAIEFPWKFLRSVAPSICQVTEEGVGFEIASTPSIDFMPPELRESTHGSEVARTL